MTMQMKGCPSCNQVNTLDTSVCVRCGHQFSTRFSKPPNPHQTQMMEAPIPPVVQYHSSAPTNGPIDSTERTVSFVWTCVGLTIAAFFFIAAVNGLYRSLIAPAQVQGFILVAVLFLLLTGAALSALAMRLRRLYLSAPDGFAPYEIAKRRSRFAVVASLVIVLLIIAGIAWPESNPQPTPLQIAPAAYSPPPPAAIPTAPLVRDPDYDPAPPRSMPRVVPDSGGFGGGSPNNSGGLGGGLGGGTAQPGPVTHPSAGFRF